MKRQIIKILAVLAAATMLFGCSEESTSTGGGSGGGGGSATLIVQNFTAATDIVYLNVSPSSSGSWGADQLGTNVLTPGGTFTLVGVSCNQNMDLRAQTWGPVTVATNYAWFFACGSTYTWQII